ncbi:GPRNPY2 [Trypoxylus dichotomus]
MFSVQTFKLLTLVAVYSYVISVVHCDAYIEESKGYCDARRDLFACAKYRVLNYIANYTENSIIVNTNGPLKLIRVDDVEGEQSFFANAPRYYSEDGEFSKFIKFVQRQINHFLNHQGIVISLPQGARLIDFSAEFKEASATRSKKKKADLLLQLVTLFKVFKIKVLVAIALVGILFIKKVLLAAAFVLPSIIHNIKMHCKAAAASNTYHHFEDHDDHIPYGAWNGLGGGYGHSGYGKDWSGNFASDKAQIYQRRH